jgi:hypothetical protein
MSARPGPCGGRSAMVVPTAIQNPFPWRPGGGFWCNRFVNHDAMRFLQSDGSNSAAVSGSGPCVGSLRPRPDAPKPRQEIRMTSGRQPNDC